MLVKVDVEAVNELIARLSPQKKTSVKVNIIAPDGSWQSTLPLIEAIKNTPELCDDLTIEVQDVFNAKNPVNINSNVVNNHGTISGGQTFQIGNH